MYHTPQLREPRGLGHPTARGTPGLLPRSNAPPWLPSGSTQHQPPGPPRSRAGCPSVPGALCTDTFPETRALERPRLLPPLSLEGEGEGASLKVWAPGPWQEGWTTGPPHIGTQTLPPHQRPTRAVSGYAPATAPSGPLLGRRPAAQGLLAPCHMDLVRLL